MRLVLLLCLLLTAGPAAAQHAAPQRAPAQRAAPVVVELFTAQGCAACPEANALVAEAGARPDVLALTYAVDYWDYLGWRDTFARPEYAERQRHYRRAFRLRDVFTPQVVVDGRAQAPGGSRAEVESLVRGALARPVDPPDTEFRAGGARVAVGSGRAPRGAADVWMVRYRPGVQTVDVRRGENRGEDVPHLNVVRELVRLGGWSGRPVLLRLPQAAEPGLATVVLVQAAGGGRILAVERQGD